MCVCVRACEVCAACLLPGIQLKRTISKSWLPHRVVTGTRRTLDMLLKETNKLGAKAADLVCVWGGGADLVGGWVGGGAGGKLGASTSQRS